MTAVTLVRLLKGQHRRHRQAHGCLYGLLTRSRWGGHCDAPDLRQILKHAIDDSTMLSYMNISVQACEALGWLTRGADSTALLADDAPEQVRQTFEELYPSATVEQTAPQIYKSLKALHSGWRILNSCSFI